MSDAAVRTIIQQEAFVTFYSDGTILFKELRASHPHLDKPWAAPPTPQNPNPQPKYNITGLAPKTKEYIPSIMMVRDHINGLIKQAKLPELPPTSKFLRDGKLRPDKPEYAGQYSLTANNDPTRPPALRGRGKDPRTGRALVIKPEDAARIFYGGCWFNLLLRPWAQNNNWGKRVNANLLAVQFVRDDEAFGEGRISDDTIDESFGAIDDDDSGYDDAALADTDEL